MDAGVLRRARAGAVAAGLAAGPVRGGSGVERALARSLQLASVAPVTTAPGEVAEDARRAGAGLPRETGPAGPASGGASWWGCWRRDGLGQLVQVLDRVEYYPAPAVAGQRVVYEVPGEAYFAPAGTPAAELEARVPGLALAADLLDLPLADVDPGVLVEAVAGWERIIAWATHRQARAVSELVNRRLHDRRTLGMVGKLSSATYELQARLATTQYAAEAKVALAAGLDTHPVVADALQTGAVDPKKADVLLFAEPCLPDDDRRRLLPGLIEQAKDLSASQLRQQVRQAALGTDPDIGAKRRKRAYADRRVEVTPADDQMAWVSAYLRADAAEATRVAVDALAAAARTPGDPRTLDQRRADAFADVFTTLLDQGTTPGGLPLPKRGPYHPHLMVTVAATTLHGLDEAPAHLAGYGPISADLARTIAKDATWRAVYTDPGGHVTAVGTRAYKPGAVIGRTVIAQNPECTFHGCRQPAWLCDLDHIDGAP
ncbi:13E12 repeat family protein [Georgenia sp. TF02-10]|uniref:DUF222 domain-containing protein n=1 Tax=Georgenia sp. TF02-10 TaxID=2917725 RepID=UPI001FA7369D|nr:DUF222 domain-containing protein [Georgenia sp. TF02-10]UNX55708.1 13E12 repeat family protein [Georgenia sp. TF02-10]